MRIGFTGAHRSGKTTLARLVSTEYGLHRVESPAGAIAAKYGFDMGADNRLALQKQPDENTGVDMQQCIMDELTTRLRGRDSFVVDRTPIDVAAYMLADATAGAGDADARHCAVKMVTDAINLTQELFDVVILVPPLPIFVEEVGKPPMNQAYQDHHHFLCRGMLFDEDLDVWWDEIRRDTFNLSERMDLVRGAIAESGVMPLTFRKPDDHPEVVWAAKQEDGVQA